MGAIYDKAQTFSTEVTPTLQKGSIYERAQAVTQQKIKPVTSIPVPKAVQMFPSTIEMLAELQIDPLSLRENPKEIISKVWEALKSPVIEAGRDIKDLFTTATTRPKIIGKELEIVADIGGIIISPISALFEGANKIPVLGSVSRLLSLPFIATGGGLADVSGKIVDELPIEDETKKDIKEGIQEIVAFAGQLVLGKITHISNKKYNELKTRFGEKDANTIVNKAQELAQQANEPVPEVVKAGLKPTEPEPINVRDIPPKMTMGELAEAAKARGFEVPEFGKESPTPKPARTFIDVPREQLPVKMEGAEKGVSALEARMKGIFETKNVEKAKVEAEARGLDVSTYDKMSKPEQIRNAAKYVEQTSQRDILEVLEGKREAPKGLLQNAIMIALEEKSLRDRNVDLAIKLASLRSTRMGQEISILTEVEGLSPVSGMNEIIRARRSATEGKMKQGETIQTKKVQTVKNITEKTDQVKLKLSEAQKLLQEITC